MGLLKDLKISLLNFSFIIIYKIHKILILIRNHLNYLKDNLSKFFLRSITYFFLKKKSAFFIIYNNGIFKS